MWAATKGGDVKKSSDKMIRIKVPVGLARFLSDGWKQGKTPMSLPEYRGKVLVMEIHKMADQVEVLQKTLKKEIENGSEGSNQEEATGETNHGETG